MTRKIAFFEGWSWFKFNNLGLALSTNLKFCTSVARVKTKSQKIFGAKSNVCRSYRGKTGRGAFLHPPPLIIMNRVKTEAFIQRCSRKNALVKILKNLLSTIKVSLHSQSGWCIEIFFWVIWVLGAFECDARFVKDTRLF